MSEQAEVLLLDAGNSFLKWALCANGELRHHGAHEYEPARKDFGIAQALRAMDGPVHRVCAASVAGDDIKLALKAAVAARFDTDIDFAMVCPQPVLEIAYAEPHLLGVDRWLAMLGACALHDGAVCVADCGTALTLDAVTAKGRHLGGAIVPGFGLMTKTLTRDTAQIGQNADPVARSFFGDSTRAAVAAGCTLALAAAVDRFVIESAAQLPAPPLLVVTGGDRERILKCTHSDAVEVPDLVLLGLKYLSVDVL